MDQTLLKYWKTCLQDAERKAIALKGPRITLNIGDKILKFIPLKSIPVIFPDWKAEDSNEKQKVMIVNPEKPDVPLNKNDAFQKVQKRHVQEKR